MMTGHDTQRYASRILTHYAQLYICSCFTWWYPYILQWQKYYIVLDKPTDESRQSLASGTIEYPWNYI